VGDAGLLLNGSGHIVEEGCRDEDLHICTLCLSNLLAEAGDTEDVVEVVGSRLTKKRPDVGDYCLKLFCLHRERKVGRGWG